MVLRPAIRYKMSANYWFIPHPQLFLWEDLTGDWRGRTEARHQK
jgi:hypothetical protein